MPSSQTPEPLSRTLAEWRVTPPRNPQFRTGVWARISGGPRETWAGYLRTHLVSWSVAAMVAFGAASWAGRAVAQTRLDGERDAMIVSYLVELDPRVQAKLRP